MHSRLIVEDRTKQQGQICGLEYVNKNKAENLLIQQLGWWRGHKVP